MSQPLPRPLPISPAVSGGMPGAANGHSALPGALGSGLLTPGTRSAAVSPSLLPMSASVNARTAAYQDALLPPPMLPPMDRSPLHPSHATGHGRSVVSQSAMTSHRSSHVTPMDGVISRSRPASVNTSPHLMHQSSASLLGLGGGPSSASVILPPITSLSLNSATPSASATPSTRLSPVSAATPHPIDTGYGTPHHQLPSISTAAHAALVSGYATAAAPPNHFAARPPTTGHIMPAMAGTVSASAPVTRCPSPRGRRRNSGGFDATIDERLTEAVRSAFPQYSVHSPPNQDMKMPRPAYAAPHAHAQPPPPPPHNSSMMAVDSYYTHASTAGLGISVPESASRAQMGTASMPGSPTHRRQHSYGHAHRGSVATTHPYDRTARPARMATRTPTLKAEGNGGAAVDLTLEGALPLGPSHPVSVPSSNGARTPLAGATGMSVAHTGLPLSNGMQIPQYGAPVTMSLPSSTATSPIGYHGSGNSSGSDGGEHSSGGGGGRSKPTSLLASTEVSALATLDRLRRRRENHNHVERRRRDHINGTIRALASLLPDRGRGADGQRRNKGAILEATVDWLSQVQHENMLLREENHMLRQRSGLAGDTNGGGMLNGGHYPAQSAPQNHPSALPTPVALADHSASASSGASMAHTSASQALPAAAIGKHHHHQHQQHEAMSTEHSQQQQAQPQLPRLSTLFTSS